MKKVTVEDIYIELESIFDNSDGHERRLKVYQKLNELMPKWEGNEQTIEVNTSDANLNIGCVSDDGVTGYCETTDITCMQYIGDGKCEYKGECKWKHPYR